MILERTLCIRLLRGAQGLAFRCQRVHDCSFSAVLRPQWLLLLLFPTQNVFSTLRGTRRLLHHKVDDVTLRGHACQKSMKTVPAKRAKRHRRGRILVIIALLGLAVLVLAVFHILGGLLVSVVLRVRLHLCRRRAGARRWRGQRRQCRREAQRLLVGVARVTAEALLLFNPLLELLDLLPGCFLRVLRGPAARFEQQFELRQPASVHHLGGRREREVGVGEEVSQRRRWPGGHGCRGRSSHRDADSIA